MSCLVNQLTVVVSYAISVLRYGEEINLFCLGGAIILFGSVYVILVHK